jgi:hypothetical protein
MTKAFARVFYVTLVLSILTQAFAPTYGDGASTTHTIAAQVEADDTHNPQRDAAPKIAPAAATDKIGDLITPKNGSANQVLIAQSDGASKSASADVAPSDEKSKSDPVNVTPNIAGSFFTPGNLVVAVSGCGIYGGGTCNPTGGTGGSTGTGSGTYGDDQAAPWTLWQYSCSGGCTTPTSLGVTYVNALALPQVTSGANLPFSNDYGSQSEGTVQLSGDNAYLTMTAFGINAADFNVNYLLYCPGNTGTLASSCVPENGNPALAQSGSLTAPVAGVSGTTAVPRVAALIDANGNINTSTVDYNVFDENDARSGYISSVSSTNMYVSGQGCKTCGPTPNQIPASGDPFDNTMGVYYTPVGATSTAPTAITGVDNGPTGCTSTSTCTSSEDTRMVAIVAPTATGTVNTTNGASGNCTADCVTYETGSEFAPSMTSITINGVNYTVSSVVNATHLALTAAPGTQTGVAYSSTTPSTLYVTTDAKPGSPGYNRSLLGTLGTPPATSLFTCGNGCSTGDGPYGPAFMPGLGNTGGTGKYTMTSTTGNNLNEGSGNTAINLSPQNFYFASPSVVYVADTGSPKNHSNGPDAICTSDGTTDSATVGDGGLQKWIYTPASFTGSVTMGSTTLTGPSGTFSTGDVGSGVSGVDIPAGTTITAYTSSTTVTMSAAATATSSTATEAVWTWSLAYTLYNGLNLILNADCDPSGPQSPGDVDAATGLYGLAGVVNGAVATLYVTSYPNNDLVQSYLWAIQDTLSTTAYPGTKFTLLDTAPAGSLFRGVTFAPSIPGGDVEITSVPSGLTVTTSGTDCGPDSAITTPLSENWNGATTCTLSVTSPQTVGGAQYTFSQWDNGSTSTTRTVTAPSSTATATYTATFSTAYQLTTSAGTGGSVSPSPGEYYYSAGNNATITATPSANYCFVNFTGAAQEGYPPVSSTSNPFTLEMNSPESITANFGDLYSPASGSTLPGTSETFSWSNCANTTAYWLNIGSTQGGNNYYSSGSLSNSTLSQNVTTLPSNGSTVYVTWYYQLNGSWIANYYSYTASRRGLG